MTEPQTITEPIHCAGCRGTDYLGRECRGREAKAAQWAAPLDYAIHRIIDVIDNDEGGAELYEAALALYRARSRHVGEDR